MLAGKRALFPSLRGIWLRRGRCLRKYANGRFVRKRQVALRAFRLFSRNLVLRCFAARLKCLIKIFVKRARRIFLRLRGDGARNDRAAKRNRGCRDPRCLRAAEQLVKRILGFRLRNVAPFLMDGIVRFGKRLVKHPDKLCLRLRLALLRFVCPGCLRKRLRRLPLVRAAAILHRKNG